MSSWARLKMITRGHVRKVLGEVHACLQLMNIFVYDWCNPGIMRDSSCDWFCLWFRVSNVSYLSVWNAPWSSAGKVSGCILLILFDGVFFAWRKIGIIYQPISYTPRFVGSRWQSHVLVYHLTPYYSKHTKPELTRLPKLVSDWESGSVYFQGVILSLFLTYVYPPDIWHFTICCARNGSSVFQFSRSARNVEPGAEPTERMGKDTTASWKLSCWMWEKSEKYTEMLHFRAGWSLYVQYLTYLNYIMEICLKTADKKNRNICLRKSEFKKTFAESQNLTCPNTNR